MNRYFLFGEAVCQGMLEDDLAGALRAIKRGETFDLFMFTSKSDITDLLNTSIGWDEFCEINEKEFKKLNKLIS